jgi:hypothetical protein
MICVGLSCGTLAEIAWTKWVKKPDVWVLAPTISAIPPEIKAETPVRLFAGLPALATELAAWQRRQARVRNPAASGLPTPRISAVA